MKHIYADMHMHSTYSDGSDTPSELVSLANARGLDAIVLADHDNMAGWEEVSHAAKQAGIWTIPGVEITTSVNKQNVHVLGYGVDPENKVLCGYLARMCLARREHTRVILEGLNEQGVLDYTWERVLGHTADRVWVCSFDIHTAMARDNALPAGMDKISFYQQYFSSKSPAYRGIEGFSPEEAIDMIRQAGGVSIIAHPKLIGDDHRVEELLAYGAQGLEVHYPAHDTGDRTRYMDMVVRAYGGLATGGTDWHGDYSQWGVEMGSCGVDEREWLLITGLAG